MRPVSRQSIDSKRPARRYSGARRGLPTHARARIVNRRAVSRSERCAGPTPRRNARKAVKRLTAARASRAFEAEPFAAQTPRAEADHGQHADGGGPPRPSNERRRSMRSRRPLLCWRQAATPRPHRVRRRDCARRCGSPAGRRRRRELSHAWTVPRQPASAEGTARLTRSKPPCARPMRAVNGRPTRSVCGRQSCEARRANAGRHHPEPPNARSEWYRRTATRSARCRRCWQSCVTTNRRAPHWEPPASDEQGRRGPQPSEPSLRGCVRATPPAPAGLVAATPAHELKRALGLAIDVAPQPSEEAAPADRSHALL